MTSFARADIEVNSSMLACLAPKPSPDLDPDASPTLFLTLILALTAPLRRAG